MYTFATHASELCENPRSSRIDGSATPTIVTSRTIIKYPRHTMTSASQRFLFVVRTGMSDDSLVVVSTKESEHPAGSRHAIAGSPARLPQRRRTGSRERDVEAGSRDPTFP